jgi:hypothetical protein
MRFIVTQLEKQPAIVSYSVEAESQEEAKAIAAEMPPDECVDAELIKSEFCETKQVILVA